VFPSEQGWFEPDDDETCRAKVQEYFQLGDYPHAVVFDKVSILCYLKKINIIMIIIRWIFSALLFIHFSVI
jgi:hypothetical protein